MILTNIVNYIYIYLCIVKVITGKVKFQGSVKFYSNNAIGFDGGAVYLLSFSQLLLENNTQLEFTNNTGRYVAVTS